MKILTKKSPNSLNPILTQLEAGIIRLYKEEKNYKVIIEGFKEIFKAAKKTNINIYPCDIASPKFSDQSHLEYRLKIGNACMIRSIEKLQFDHQHSKFLALVGLAHAKNIAQELSVPSCFLGEKKQSQTYQKYTQALDYLCFSQQKSLTTSGNIPFWASPANIFDQNKDPKIKLIITHWNRITQKISIDFSRIPNQEVNKAKDTYIEYILEKASTHTENEISVICTSSQPFIIEHLSNAIYPKCIELIHPKNWFSLFQCHRRYGIRLAETEPDTFTVTHLNELAIHKTPEISIKLHHA